MSNHDDLSKENEQQTKSIRHLQTKIKLLEKSQNDLYKNTNQIERENKTLKTQVGFLLMLNDFNLDLYSYFTYLKTRSKIEIRK